MVVIQHSDLHVTISSQSER